MADKKCCILFLVLYTIAFWSFIVAIGSIAVRDFAGQNAYQELGGNLVSTVYDLGRDWQKKWFTNLVVVRDQNCPPDHEPVYERVFHGLQTGCDCLGISDRWIITDDTFTYGPACHHNQTRAGCRTAQPFPPVKLNRMHGGRTICGKTGEAFVNATRPYFNGDTWRCPDGQAACGQVDLSLMPPGKPESVICIPADRLEEDCPITDIKFFYIDDGIYSPTISEPDGYWKFVSYHSKNEVLVSDSLGPIDVEIAYSKLKKQLPLTNLKIDGRSCRNPGQSRREYAYPTEISKKDCEFGRDNRYENSGMVKLNEYDLMSQGGIMKMMEDMPSFWKYGGGEDAYKDHELFIYNRPTGSWSIQCEIDGKTLGEAVKRTQIQLQFSTDSLHVANCGYAITIIFPFSCCCFCCFAVIGKNSGAIAVYIFCKRICWVIMGVIMMVYLEQMRSQAEANIDKVNEYVIINECADKEEAVDISTIQALQDENINRISYLYSMCQVAFIFIGIEVTFGGCMVCCSMFGRNGPSCGTTFSRNCGALCKETKELYKLAKYGG